MGHFDYYKYDKNWFIDPIYKEMSSHEMKEQLGIL